jgi:hypothetical protein
MRSWPKGAAVVTEAVRAMGVSFFLKLDDGESVL